ncbi:hypothetical protein PWT90_11213 [Aphanocladium album]|nr:hypothetical protein PWT90_11213 [Aphanocladium album]
MVTSSPSMSLPAIALAPYTPNRRCKQSKDKEILANCPLGTTLYRVYVHKRTREKDNPNSSSALSPTGQPTGYIEFSYPACPTAQFELPVGPHVRPVLSRSPILPSALSNKRVLDPFPTTAPPAPYGVTNPFTLSPVG